MLESPTFWEEHNSLVSEPVDLDGREMEDNRISKLESDMATFKTDIQSQLQQILAAVNNQMEHFAVTQNLRDTEGSFGSFNHGKRRVNGETSTGGYLPRLVKLEFPRYNGEEPNQLGLQSRPVF